MKIRILYIEPIEDPIKKAYIDFEVKYSPEKWEIFRNYIYYEKGIKKWVSPGMVKRNDSFEVRYERSPSLHKIYPKLLTAIKEVIERNEGVLKNGIPLGSEPFGALSK